MNKEDIKQFVKAFEDFMNHFEVESVNYLTEQEYLEYQRQSKMMIEMEIEAKAKELNVTPEYYAQEFM